MNHDPEATNVLRLPAGSILRAEYHEDGTIDMRVNDQARKVIAVGAFLVTKEDEV